MVDTSSIVQDLTGTVIRTPSAAVPEPMMPGTWYLIMIFIFGLIIAGIGLYLAVIKLWGSPMFVAKSARTSGKSIIQHFETGKNAFFKLAEVIGGAFRHEYVGDGTLIALPKGVSNIEGYQFVNSWSLFGCSVPCFLLGGIVKLREQGLLTREMVEKKIADTPEFQQTNLITDGYNFNNFIELDKQANGYKKVIPLEIEHTSDFIENSNQHYTEADIQLELKASLLNYTDNFGTVMMATAFAFLIIIIGFYIAWGAV